MSSINHYRKFASLVGLETPNPGFAEDDEQPCKPV